MADSRMNRSFNQTAFGQNGSRKEPKLFEIQVDLFSQFIALHAQ